MTHIIKRLKQLSAVALFVLLPGSALAEHPLTYLAGQWSGSGSTSGMQAALEVVWEPALNGRYYSLQIKNQMTAENGQLYHFAGVAYYQAGEGDSLSGVWVDSQGDILPIKARLEGQTLIANWGEADTKHGRSSYHLSPGGVLEIVDEVGTKDGNYKEFGRFKLTKESTP